MIPKVSKELFDRIMYVLKLMLKDYDIMFVYFGGSVAYQCYEEGKSDYDINVVVKDFKGYFHTNCNDIDFFVYGDKEAMDKQHMADYLPLYYKTYIDEVLGLDETLIYLNPKYQKEFNEYKNIEIEKNLVRFLDIFISYHQDIIDDENRLGVKRLYHVIRLHEILANYKNTGKYSLDISDETRKISAVFKRNFDNEQGLDIYNNVIIPAFLDIKNYLNELKEGETSG